MAQTIKLRRSSISGAVPTTSSLSLGEVAINTYDGKMYIKKNDGSDAIVEVGVNSTIAATTLTGNLSMGDDIRARFGDSNDLQIYHDGSHSYIKDNGTGNLYLGGSGAISFNSSDFGETYAIMNDDGAVVLYHNNVAKLSTDAQGINVTGGIDVADITATGNVTLNSDNGTAYFGAGADLRIYHDGNHARVRNTTGNFNIQTDTFHITDSGNVAASFVVNKTGNTSLRYNQAEKLATTSSGINVTGSVTADGLSTSSGTALVGEGASGGSTQLIYWNGTNAYYGRNYLGGSVSTHQFRSGGATKLTVNSTGIDVTGTGTFSGNVDINSDGGQLQFGADNDMQIYHNGANGEINVPATDFTIDAGGDIKLDSTGSWRFQRNGGSIIELSVGSGNSPTFYSANSDADIIFRGNDGGTPTTALTLDMSDAGVAFFNSDIRLVDNAVIRLGDGQDFRLWHDGSHNIIQSTLVDSDIYIKGNDGGSTITMLGFDTSAGGNATFSGSVTANSGGGDAVLGSHLDLGDNQKARFGASDDLQIYHDGSNSYIDETGTGSLNIRSSATLRLQNSSGTNFLYGTTGGEVVLYHNGIGKLSTLSTGIQVIGSVTSTGLTSAGTILATSSTTISTILRGGDGNSKNLVFQKTTGSAQQAKISAVGDDLRFTTGTTTERMRIDSSGNVGIGNVVSQAYVNEGTYTTKLRVGSDTLTTDQSSAVQIVGKDSTGNGILGVIEFLNHRDNDVVAKIAGRRDLGSSSYLGAGQLDFSTDDGNGNLDIRMSIDANGNVGIGTTSPAQKFHVAAGYIHVDAGYGITWDNTHERIEQSDGKLEFFTNNGEAMTLSGSNLGIGTTAPAAQLHVKSVGNGEIEVERTSGALINLQAQSAAGYIGTDSNHLFGLKANGTVRLKIATGGAISFNDAFTFPIVDGSANQLLKTDGSGNMSWATVAGVGDADIISDADGDTKIQVEESADEDKIRFDAAGVERFRVGSDVEVIAATDFNITGTNRRFSFTSGTGTVRTTGAYSLNLGTNSADRLTINSSGNVGIGTTAPTSALEVNGTIRTDLIQTTTTSMSALSFLNLDMDTGASSGTNNVALASVNNMDFLIDTNNNGTTGAFVFGTDANTMSSATELMRLNESGSLGIGTSSPYNKLHVNGTGRINSLIVGDASASNTPAVALHIKSSATNARLRIEDSDSSNDYWDFYVNQGDGLHFQEDGANRVTFKTGGNVGIGTTAPGHLLHVTGADGSIANMVVNNDNVALRMSAYTNSHGEIRVETNHPLVFKTNGNNERMRIMANGNVGIGTTTPDTKLDVENNANSTTTIRVNNATGGTAARANLRMLSDSAQFDLYATSSSYTGITGWADAGILSTGSTASAGLILNAQAGGIKFQYGTTTKALIDTSGRLLINATTTAFSDKLYVNGDAYVTGGWRIGTGATYTGKIYNSSGIMSIETDSNRDIQFGDSGTPAIMYIDTSTENVGIGTTAPSFKLHVDSGTANTAGYFKSTDNKASILIADNDTNTYVSAEGSTSSIGANSGRHANNLNITSTGAVGIGTTSPDRKLHVSDSGTTVAIKVEATDGNQSSLDLKNSEGWFRLINDGGELSIYDQTDTTERFRIDTSGNVGIGTTSPDAKLQVEHNGGHTSGNVALTHSSLDLYNPLAANTNEKGSVLTFSDNYFDGTTYPRTTRAAIKGGTDTIGNTADGFLAFYTDAGGANSMPERMRIDHDGKVGIGTTSPAQKLHVSAGSTNANIIARLEQGTTAGNYSAIEVGRTDGSGNVHITPAVTGGVPIGGTAGILLGSTNGSIPAVGIQTPNSSNGHIVFNPKGTEKVRITADGNVGIGTTAPTNTDYGSVIPKLHVKQSNTTGAFNLVARFEAGSDAEATGGAILINHSNDRGMLIEGGRDGSGAAADDDGVGHLGLLTSSGAHTRMVTLRQNMVGASSVYNVGIGTTTPQAKFQVQQLGINVNQSSVTSTSQYACDSMSATVFRSSRYTVQITNVTDSTYQITEILLIHDGTTPSITEYGTIFTGSAAEATFDADITSGNVRLLATPASTDSMQFKVVRHSILV